MLVLAIDTSGNTASVALACEDALVSEITFAHRMDLLRRLLPNVERLFFDTGRDRRDIEGIAISLGPGSFTGLRIGMAAAKSMAQALGAPIVGISTLDALAWGASAALGKAIAPLIHAKPGELYWAFYDNDEFGPTRATEDRASTVEEMIECVTSLKSEPTDRIVFLGDGAAVNRKTILDRFGNGCVLDEWFDLPRGHVIARLGIRRLEAGDADDVMTIVPSYVRRPTPVVRMEK